MQDYVKHAIIYITSQKEVSRMNRIIGITTGRIAGIEYVKNDFFIRFESDEGVNELTSFDHQQHSISRLFSLESSDFLTQLVGKRVKLIFGPLLSTESNAAMLYGFSKEDGDEFVIPQYLFGIAKLDMKKNFYSSSEVLDFMEYVEEIL